MNKLRLSKRKGLTLVVIALALVLCLSALFATLLNIGLFNASADTVVGDRIEMKDLFNRYPMDAVIGPVDVEDVNDDGKIDRNDLDNLGKYTYIKDDDHKDIDGNYTNNIYGIPASRYFDVESYIYTTGVKDSDEGRTLYGWNAAIRGVNPGSAHKSNPGQVQRSIAENGEILKDGFLASSAQTIGIYVYFDTTLRFSWFGTTFKYALIVPNDITAVAGGSAAFVGYDSNNKLRSYYSKTSYPNDSGESGYNASYVAQYTDFASFYDGGDNVNNAPYFWQPRERLVGVYFDNDSRLNSIADGTANADTGMAGGNRNTTGYIGKSAFAYCDNMRFFVMPEGVESIGRSAFYTCAQLADTNIPSSVKSIGASAYINCSALQHISLPTNAELTIPTGVFSGCTKIRHVDNPSKYNSGNFPSGTTNSTLFVMGNKPENGVLDKGAFMFEYTSAGKLTALSLAGETGENSDKLFVFPSGGDFNDDGDRRDGVTYDYLDCDGKKVKVSLNGLNLNITEYDIGSGFAEDTWCQNVILPKEVKTIGASAFNKSHVKYLETYATTIGASAFADDNSGSTTQWFYFHQIKNSSGNFTAYSVQSNSFSKTPGTRDIVFENKELYAFATANTNFKTNVIDIMTSNQTLRYQIPIIANVDNGDSKAVTINQGDMAERFFNDSDYIENPSIANGIGTITYTKRLSGATYDFIKQRTGEWKADSVVAGAHSNPTLSNMNSTVWYANDTYASVTNAATLYGNANTVYSGSSVSSINLYTKNIARPTNIADGSYDGKYKGQYTFGETYTFGANSYTLGDDNAQCIDFYIALGLSTDDYTLNVTTSSGTKTCDFAYPDGQPGVATNLHNAGTYSFAVSLNPKWGVWSSEFVNAEENSKYLNASITVNRKKLDYSSLDSIPKFVNALGETNVMHGNSTPIYNYNDGWYVAQQNDAIPNDTRTVTNSYVYHTGSAITIKLQGEVVSADGESSTLGDVRITSRNGLTFTNSNRYTASFQFEVKTVPGNTAQSNYYFDYGDNNYGINDETLGVSISNPQPFSFRLSKRWYIVVETNMFIVSGSGNASPYSPLVNPNVHYADTIAVQTPALRKGADNGTIEYEIIYVGTNGNAIALTGKEADGSNTKLSLSSNALSYYINSSMPVGVYTLKLYGSAASDGEKTYPAITGEYTLVVSPKTFDSELVQNIHDIMNVNGAVGNAYPLDRNKALHDSIKDEVDALTDNLQMPASGNYWSDKTQYFDTEVAVLYNVNGSGNTAYYNASTTLNNLNTAGKYTLYYSISAKNYETIGGADASDRTERSFVTTLYTEMRFDEIYAQIIDVSNPYFNDVTFTGSQAQTLVPRNQYYNYSFDDVDADGNPNYINARNGASVTLKLYDPDLARWNTVLVNANNEFTEEQINNASNYFELSADKQSLKVFFNINPATNSWNVVPQMPSWSFNGFDTTVNFITAGLTFDGAVVEYELSSDLATWTAPFTVDSNGIVDDATAELLNKLKPASYYLRSRISDITYVNEDGETVTNVEGIEFITQNTSGSYIKSVSVSKAVNSWTETPTVMTWTWGSYDKDRNTISATATYPTLKPTYGNVVDEAFVYTNGEAALPVVTFSIQRKVGNTLVAIAGLESFTTVDDAISAVLAGLHAGTYVLTTGVGGSDYYTQIAATSTNFVIAQSVNSWTTTPQITQWTWGQFNQDVNVILAEAQFNGGDGSDGSQDNAITFSVLNSSRVAVNATLSNFVLTDGAYSEAVANALKELFAGTYYLRAEKGGNNDYASIVGSNSTDILFTVAKANNSWQTSPAVTSWQYTRFDADSNFIAGIPTYSTPDKVVYKLVDKTGNEITLGYTYENGVIKLNDAAVKALSDLTVGNYTINVTLEGTDNYSPLPDTLTFSVAGVTNSWDTTPRLSSFKYGQFSAASNFTAGVPHYPTDDKTVQYGIFSKNIANFAAFVAETSGIKFSAIDTDITDYLNGLDAGLYYFAAYVASDSDNNYSELYLCTEFNIGQATNAWKNGQVPAIGGWTYGSFTADLFTDGSANHGAHVYSIQEVDNNGNIIGGNITISGSAKTEWTYSELSALLSSLGAGKYNLRASVEETDNYDGVTHDVRFAVAKADNAWTDNTAPSIEGWTFNSTPSEHTNATAVVNTGDIDYKYYKATLVNGDWVRDGNAIELAANTPAGDYVMIATAPSNDNYNELVHTVHFTVAKRANSWTNEPEDRLDWTWGATSIVDSSRLVNAQAIEGSDNITYTIFKINDDNTSVPVTLPNDGEINASNIQAVLKTLGKGNYRITTTVSATTNYGALTKVTTVTVSNATLTVTTEPSSEGWTWGVNDSQKVFNNIVVSTVLTSDQSKVNVTYKLGEKNDYDYDGMLAALQGYDAGTYTVTVTVTCPNYDNVERTVSVKIDKADFVWETNPTSTNWIWNSLSNDGKTVIEPKAKDLDGQYIVFTFTRTVGSDTTTYSSFSDLQGRLFIAPVGTYTINVSYQRDNYNSIDKSFTVTVNKATNEWTSNAPQASYECEYTNKASINILQAAAKFGTVVYQDAAGNKLMNGSTDITTAEELTAWIQTLVANDNTPYVFYTVVVSDGNNYDELKVKTEVLITGTKSYWANKDDIEDDVSLTFSDTLSDDLGSELANIIPIGDSTKGTTTYTINYGDGQNATFINDTTAVINWIKANITAVGTYTIDSEFVPTDKSYTTLNHTLTVEISLAQPVWETTLNDNYYGSYGDIEVATPTVSGFSAPITVQLVSLDGGNQATIVVTLKDGLIIAVTENGEAVSGYNGMSFAEYAKTLNAVTTYYSVTYKVDATDNYDGTETKTSRLYISPIVNTWLDSELEDGKTITAEDWTNGYTWTFTRGDTVKVTLPVAKTGNDSIKITREDGAELGYKTEDGLNSYLATANLAAGTYKLVFTIPQSGNYNGLVSNCQIVIEKNSNDWKSQLANYSGNGNVDLDSFTLPEATVQNNLLRFNVVKADGSIIGTGLVLGTGAENETNTFLAILKTLANGTYTVTAYVGGTAGYGYESLDDTNPLKIALDKYNADYSTLTSVCVITLTPHENDWTATISGQSWTWKELNKNSITEPKADWGNDKIEYTLRSGNTILETFNVTKYGQSVFDVFTTYLSNLDAGTYSVTVAIAGTDIYNAPETLTAVFVVSPVNTAWTLSDSELAAYEYISGAWGSFQGTELPNLAVANWSDAQIIYEVDGKEVTDSGIYSNPWVNALKNIEKVGVYTFTAKVNADAKGNHTALTFRARVTVTQIQSSWDEATTENNGAEYNWIYADSDNAEIAKPIISVAASKVVTYTLSKRGSTGTLYSGQDWNDANKESLITTLNAQPSGEYIITASVAGNDNYTALNYSVTVVVSLATNSWKQHMNTENVENYTVTWTYKATDNTPIVYEANYGDLEITVDGGKVAIDKLDETLKALTAGEHAIVASVKADAMYGALSETIKLIVKKAPNSWTTTLEISDWTWNDISQYAMDIDFTAPVPAQGTTSNVTVRNASDVIVLEATLNYVDSSDGKIVIKDVYDAFVRKLCALDVGTYTISVVVNETENYAAPTTETATFAITQATNGWAANGEPTISGWSFGGDIVYPSATPKFGKNTVQFSYTEVKETDGDTPSADAKWSDAPGYMAGKYWLRAYVAGTDNYSELTDYIKFEIGAGQNSWVKQPDVIVWNWNGYDKDANLFSGSARSGGKVTFTITKEDGSASGKELTASDFKVYGGAVLGDISKLKNFELDSDGKVNDVVAALLKALRDGRYLLTAYAEGGESLLPISSSKNFVISKADNEWTTAPNVLSYDYNGFVLSGERASFTAGESKYGTVSYLVSDGNDKYYVLDSNGKVTTLTTAQTLTEAQVKALLPKLNASNYMLKAWVAAGDTYEAFYTQSAPYHILFSVARIENEWTTEQQNAVEAYYTDLNAKDNSNNYTFDFEAWFIEQKALHGDKIAYALLDTNYNALKNETYDYGDDLFAAIRLLGAGNYIIRMSMSAEEAGNYLALTAYASLTIKRYDNSFTAFPTSNLSGQWQQKYDEDNKKLVNDSTLDSFTVTAAKGNNTVTYTINGVECATLTKLSEEVAKLNAGSYQVTIAVKETDDYEGLSRTVQLDIAQGENELHWSIDSDWTWHNGLAHFTGSKPQHGDQVTVEITKKNSSSASSITIDFSLDDPLAIINQVICGLNSSEGIIGGLDAGEYTIKVTANATANWKEVSETATFTINKTPNSWTNAPTLNGTLVGNVYKYEFGDTITPSATAQHGTVKYTYYLKGNTTPLSAKPTDVGEYYIEVSVDATDNHQGITASTLYFNIDKVLNDNFIVSPAAIGWTWGSYDRTVHMFTGIPRSGGEVSFSILYENKNIAEVNGIKLDKILLVDKDGVHHNDVDKDLYVPEVAIVNGQQVRYADLIKLLKEGAYYLQINVAATDNNEAFTNSDARFRVTAAENGWKVTPKIASWSLELWSAEKNSPQAEPRFGTARIVVRSQNNNEVFYDNMFVDDDGNTVVLNRLDKALAGWYKMTVTVDALEGCYTGLNETVDVQVYMRGSNETKNYWYETYGITSWEAVVGNIGNKPYGTPLRGLPYFEFYYAKRDADNKLVIDWDRPVVAGEDSYLVKKGDNEFYQAFYVPMAPGDYFMVACAVNVDSEGNVIEADNLRESDKPYPLHIEYRANTFTDDPRIDTLLFLGDRANWAQPTAKASLSDSEIWFTYQNVLTGEDLGKNMPNAEGKYRVTAHILAKYSNEETKSANFEVELSTNEWLEQPTIEDWSEEFLEKEPAALSKFGADSIVYTYENLETGEKFDYKPTTEGTYKMTATVKLKGYRDLVGTATFTIEPAFDRDLVLIDIVLGLIGCALAVFVIIFAIRRYKEN